MPHWVTHQQGRGVAQVVNLTAECLGHRHAPGLVAQISDPALTSTSTCLSTHMALQRCPGSAHSVYGGRCRAC